jgi:hypothetical protein
MVKHLKILLDAYYQTDFHYEYLWLIYIQKVITLSCKVYVGFCFKILEYVITKFDKGELMKWFFLKDEN